MFNPAQRQNLCPYPNPAIWAVICLLLAAGCSTTAVHYRQRPEVSVTSNAINLHFPGDPAVEACVAIENGEVLGLSHITIDGCEVLDSAHPTPPVARVVTGGSIEPVGDLDAYLAERQRVGEQHTFPSRGELKTTDVPLRGRYAGWRQSRGAVVLDVALPRGRAEWWLRPASTRVYNQTYSGVSWQLRLYDVGRVYEVDVEEPVVFAEGDWRFQQRGSQSDDKNEEEFQLSLRPDPQRPYSMSKRKYGARQQPFFFLAGTRGSTLSFFDRLTCADVEESQKDNRIALRSTIPVRPDAEGCIETPAKAWLFRRADLSDKWGAVNEWSWAFDRVVGDLQAQAGVKAVEPLPILFHQQFDTPGLEFGLTPGLRKQMAPPPLEESWLFRFTNEVVPKAASWGIGVIELRAVLDTDIDHGETEYPAGSFAADSVCSPWGLRISPKLGGEEGLAYMVEQARARGIQIAIWSAPAHQSVCSPVVRAHPDWLMFDASGRAINRGYVTLVGMDLAAGFRKYLEGAYRDLHARTGVDGVWADSYCAFGADRDMSDTAPYPQLDQAVMLQRAMQRMGYTYLMREDCGPIGLSSRSSGLVGVLGREYLRYYFLYNHQDPTKRYDPESCFRSLASKGVMDIRVPGEFEALPNEARDMIVRTNFAYREVLPLMKRRIVLGDDTTWQGVAWADQRDRVRVLFSFETFDWPIPNGARVRELMTGETLTVPGSHLRAQPWHIYALLP